MYFNYNTEELNSIKEFTEKGSMKSNSMTKNCIYYSFEDYHKKVPTELVFNSTYRRNLLSASIDLILDDNDMVRYRYKPKMLSYDLYGSVDFWYILLIINNMKSIMEFDQKHIKIIATDKIGMVADIVNANYEDIQKHNSKPQLVRNI